MAFQKGEILRHVRTGNKIEFICYIDDWIDSTGDDCLAWNLSGDGGKYHYNSGYYWFGDKRRHVLTELDRMHKDSITLNGNLH